MSLNYNDLSNGLGDWNNIQDNIRFAFQHLYDEQKKNSETIDEMRETNKDLREIVNNQQSIINDLQEQIYNIQKNGLTRTDLGDINKTIKKRASKQSVESIHKSLKNIETTQAENNYSLQLALKPDKSEVLSMIQSSIAEARLSKQHSSEEVSTMLNKKVSSSDFHLLLSSKAERSEVKSALQRKADISQVRKELTDSLSKLGSELNKSLKTLHKDLVTVLNKKAYKSDVSKSLKLKANAIDMETKLGTKADINDVKDALRLKLNATDAQKLAQSNIDTNEIREMKKMLLLKADVKDVCALLENKPNMSTFTDEIGRLHTELSQKVSTIDITDIRQLVDDTKGRHAWLDKPTGRWIWKTQKLSKNKAIPWNVQILNSSPRNLRWEPDGDYLIAELPGLYEIAIGIFSERIPAIQIFVNDEPALDFCERKGSFHCHTVSRRAKHTAGLVAGYTISEFVALPQSAKITIVCKGVDMAQGYLSLKKL